MAELKFPIQDRSDDLALEFGGVVGRAVQRGQLDETEAAIAREVGIRLLLAGARTVGDAEDALEAMSPAESRRLLNEARVASSMNTVEAEEAERRFQAANSFSHPFTDDQGLTLQACHDPGCKAMPTHPGGALRPVADRRWWCPNHRDQAGPEDHLPPEPKYVLGPNFNLIPVGEEAERLRAEDERLRQAQAEKNRQRKEHAEAISKVQNRYEDQAVISIAGLRMRPDGRLVQ